MKIKIGILTGIVLCFYSALPAMVIHNYCCNKGEVTRNEPGKYNEDYLFLGYELDFSGEAEDLVFLGKNLNFSGITKLGLIAFGEKLNYSGRSGNGVIAAGADLDINGTITGTNYIACKTCLIHDSANIAGDAFVACAKIVIDGNVKGNLYVASGELVINNEIKGDVSAYTGRIIIGEKGKINGNLYYSSKEKLTEDELKRVSGTVTVDEKRSAAIKQKSPGKTKSKAAGVIVCFIFFLSYIIISSLLLLIPVFKKLENKQSDKAFWTTSLFGLIPVFIYPATIVFCFIMVITIPFALMLILGFLPLFYMTNLIGTVLVGKYLVTKLKWKIEKRHFLFYIGALFGAVIATIPGINFLYLLFTSALGWGVFISFLLDKNIVDNV